MSLNLLIADDEAVISNGIAKYIKLHTDRFSQIFIADNGQKALDIINQHRPDIMILDIQMPVKNGVEVMKEASRSSVQPATVILSGHDEFEFTQQAIRYGAKEYLLKPACSTDILQCVNNLADKLTNTSKEPTAGKDNKCNYLVASANEYINENYHKNITLTQVADKLGITGGYLSTLFSKNLNCCFIDYVNKIRVEHACSYLSQTSYKIYEVAYKTGFQDEKYFTKTFRKLKGMTPKEYRSLHSDY